MPTLNQVHIPGPVRISKKVSKLPLKLQQLWKRVVGHLMTKGRQSEDQAAALADRIIKDKLMQLEETELLLEWRGIQPATLLSIFGKKRLDELKVWKPTTFFYADIWDHNSQMVSNAPGMVVAKSEIEVLRTGTWFHREYGWFTITSEIIQKMIDNWTGGKRKVMVDYLHQSSSENPENAIASGWMEGLKSVVDNGVTKLLATVEWTAKAAQHIKNKEYRFISPEFNLHWVSKDTGEDVGPTLLAIGLVNRPFIEGMAPVVLSERSMSMPGLKTKPKKPVRKTPTLELDEEQQELRMEESESLQEAFNRLSEVLNKLFSDVGTDPPEDIEEAMTLLFEKISEYGDGKSEMSDIVAAMETAVDSWSVALSEVQLPKPEKAAGFRGALSLAEKKLRDENKVLSEANTKLADRVGLLEAKDKRNAAFLLVEGYITDPKEPRLLPAQREDMIEYVIDKGEEKFKKFVEAMPIVVKLGEQGSGSDKETPPAGDPQAEIIKAANVLFDEKVKSDKNYTWPDAYEAVGKLPENKKLVEDYRKSVGAI